MDVIPIILSGGGGTRLWPLSSPSIPKQFIKLDDESSLYEKSLLRINSLQKDISIKKIIIVSSVHNKYQIIDQSSCLSKSIKKSYIFETEKEDTLRAIYRGVTLNKNNAIFIVLPSDHLIHDSKKFSESIKQSISLVIKKGGISLIGIKPSEPSEKYGYIQTNLRKGSRAKSGSVIKFHEKPSKKVASKYLNSDSNYYWNSGISIFKKEDLLDDIFRLYGSIGVNKSNCLNSLPKVSFDTGVLEKSNNIHITPHKGDWSDLGSWSTITKILKSDKDNYYYGKFASLDSNGNIVINDTINPISIYGVKKHLILNYQNRIFMSPLNKLDNVKRFTNFLNSDESLQEIINGDVNVRPWGSFQNLFETTQFKLKKIIVKPKQILSLQYHKHRYESWFIISGRGVVALNKKNIQISKNQSIFIDKGATHRVTNTSKTKDLIFVEVQAGKILSESDIIRLEDNYNRI